MKKILFLLMFMVSAAFCNKIIVDQFGKKVTLPDHVNRIIVIQQQSLGTLIQINALDKVVAIQANLEKNLGKHYLRLAPLLKDLPTSGGLKGINIEEIVKLNQM